MTLLRKSKCRRCERWICLCRDTAIIAPASLGDILKQARLDRGETLRDVERATGISNPYLSQLESGRIADPGARKLYRLAKHFGLSVECLCELLESDEAEP